MSASAAADVTESSEDYAFAVAPQSYWGKVWRRFIRHRLAALSLLTLALLFTAGFLAHHLAPYTYDAVNLRALSTGPSWAHPFGTDQFGRDYLSRVLLAIGTEARIALAVGLVVTVIGTVLGVASGYFGGLIDNLLMRFTDVFLTMPPLITLLVAASYLNVTTVFKVGVLIGCILWMPIARVARSTCLSLREKDFVDAARAVGASDLRIITRHLLPNTIGPVVVAATLMTAAAVVLEVTIAYLGFGVSGFVRSASRTPSIGEVMSDANSEGLFHWWGILFPGLAVVLIIAPILFIGDALRDALDPNERRYVAPRKRRARPSLAARALARLPSPDAPIDRLKDTLRELFRPVFASATAARLGLEDWTARRARRRRRRLRLVLEALVVSALTAGVAVGIFLWQYHPVRSPWRIAGAGAQNVSRAIGAQTEAAVSIGPSDQHVLFAASNDSLLRTIRVYTSTDAGRTWSSTAGPALGGDACARGEPSVATSRDGREYVAFIVNSHCLQFDPYPYLVVASRAGPTGGWNVRRVMPPSETHWDDKPAMATAPSGRVYLIWSRLLNRDYATTVVSSSEDHGRTWSNPKPVSGRLSFPQLVSAGVGAGGAMYIVGVDSFYGIWAARSNDRATHFTVRQVYALPDTVASSCILASYRPIPQQANRCLGPNPSVAITPRRVFVTYAGGVPYATNGVSVATLDPALNVLSRRRIPARDNTAQFWPASAVDARTGRLWVCFYDTTGDPSRKQAWFSCAASRDGRRWTTPVRASSVSADPTVLWEDSRIYGFGDEIGYGGYTALVAARGVAHPFWIDTQDLNGKKQEIFTARIPDL